MDAVLGRTVMRKARTAAWSAMVERFQLTRAVEALRVLATVLVGPKGVTPV
jgi:hypothetical protein